ncbi:MAG: dinitrogenase iron-molybdenum cofactor biosynthesis protein [Gammaproteobacteria bacterium]|nr:MAG: dinitrogenase iron-molybdenum cofactor biosynthesis protein [Gammaproteobacteria bacterium]RKZ44479.1 MAG: dinitrogenase iron-molybdenum cofactor biosynthesis protein [Gammaproteobacteria bacterium]
MPAGDQPSIYKRTTIMKIIVTSTGDGMNATVDPHFGRCSYFAIVDTESGDFEAIANQYKDAAGGAGTKAAQFIIDKGVGALLTGHCGPKASEVLDDTDIQIVSGINKGTVMEAVNAFKEVGRGQGGGQGGNR